MKTPHERQNDTPAPQGYLSDIVGALVAVRDTLPDSDEAIDPLFPFAAPVWPREEMQVMFRYFAGLNDLPRRCPNRGCRRVGHCRAGADELPESACRPLWTHDDFERLHAAWLGIALGWIYNAERHAFVTGIANEENGDAVAETPRDADVKTAT
ncbi:hypothetical protein [uncultured Nitratireductor sp.]|uniref:hypothetical protein n=1 Tax=uncultured Nitratireductor sp. TaxID=520953 RepID=UPI0025E56338|nr:hypothetical protein [uncultured Nitratireductor sp.]